jgi:hypothetical protein
MGVSS